MICVCVACMLQQPSAPSLYVLSAEQRKVFQTIISPDVIIEGLEHLKLLVCINCLRLLKVVQAFQQKALRGARNLIMLYKTMEQHNLVQNTIQVKEELDPLSPSATIVPKHPAPIKDEPQNIISGEPGTHDREIKQENSLSEELVVKNEPEADHSDSDTLSAESDGETNIRESTTESVEKPLNTITETQGDVHFKVLTHRKMSENQSNKLTSDAANVSPSLEANTRIPQPDPSIDKDRQQNMRKQYRRLGDAEKQEVVNTYNRLYKYWPNNEYFSKGILLAKTAEIHGVCSMVVWKIVNSHSLTPKECKECGMSLSSSTALRRHMQAKHTKATPCKCDICGFVFKNDFRLFHHKKNKHTVQVEVESCIDNLNLEWFCSECQVQFATERRFKLHRMSLKHAGRDRGRFQCDICQKRFSTKKGLEGHVNTQHLKKYNYKCDKCDKRFWTRSDLRKHVAVVHDKQRARKRYICDQCGAGYTSPKSLREHLFKHSGARPFACARCPAAFTYSAALYTHNRLKHLNIKPKSHQRNRKRGNKKENKDAEGIDEGTKRIDEDTVGTEDGDEGGMDCEDIAGLGGDTVGTLIDILQDNNFG